MWFDFLSVSWYQVHKYSIKPLDSKEVLRIQNKGTPVDIDPTPGRLGFYQLSLLTHQQNALKWKKKVYRRLENRWGSKSTPGIKWRWNWVQDNRNLWNIMGKLLTDGPSSHIWGCHLRNWWNWRGHIHQKKESTTTIHIACASHQILKLSIFNKDLSFTMLGQGETGKTTDQEISDKYLISVYERFWKFNGQRSFQMKTYGKGHNKAI